MADLLVTLTGGHVCGIDKQKFALLRDKVRTVQPITTKLGSYISLIMFITWFDLGGMLLKLLFCHIFFENFGCVFQDQTLFWTYLRNGWSDWCDTKRVALVRYWVNYMTWPLTSPMALNFIFQGQISKSQESLPGWCETKIKQIN